MKINKLRRAQLDRFEPDGKLHGDGGGLHFRSTAAKGQGSWIYKGSDPDKEGRDSQLGLGPYPLVGLEDARTAARELGARLRIGGTNGL